MGFSVSGATVVLFLGVFISFGIAYTAANNGFEQVHGAYQDSTDEALTQENTGVEIASASVANTGSGLYLNVSVNNTGTTSLSVNDTDVLVDGRYVSHDETETVAVEGNEETDVWLPGETLHVNVSMSETPTRVKIVTGPGVADAEVI